MAMIYNDYQKHLHALTEAPQVGGLVANQKPSPFHSVRNARERVYELEKRVAALTDRLVGSLDGSTSEPMPPVHSGLFYELQDVTSGIFSSVNRMNEALDIIERQLP